MEEDKRVIQKAWALCAVGCLLLPWDAPAEGHLPGERVLLSAHNSYPTGPVGADRLERALALGVPVSVEVDLYWHVESDGTGGRLVVAHGPETSGHEPSFDEYFFETVRPIVEKALESDDQSQWPLITLFLDLRPSGAPELLRAFWDELGRHEDWLCTAEKGARIEEVRPLDVRPILVLDAASNREVFYDAVPLGGRLRVFGIAPAPSAAAEAQDPASLLPAPADNFHRWWNLSWAVVEGTPPPQAGDWTDEERRRLEAIVSRAHEQGYWVRLYTLNGYPPDQLKSWNPRYNFGSREAAVLRWSACIEAGVDFIATDDYEGLHEVLSGASPGSAAPRP